MTTQRIERIAEQYPRIVRGDVRRALTAFAEEQEKWQPIETAPKDGTDILLWWPSVESSRPVIGWWSNYRARWDIVKDTIGDLPPTHWQPLPPKPE